jgi:cytochrome P450
MDGAEHLRHRNIVTPALAPRALKGELPAFVSGVAREIIGEFAAAGRAELVEQFTFNYPLRIFTEILGLPVDDFDLIHQMAIDLSHIGTDPGRALAASKSLGEHLLPIVKQRRENPQADLISRLVVSEVEGEQLEDEEVVSFCRLLVSAGAETTYHLIGTALYALLTHRGQLEEVLADRSLLQNVIDETLRWETPVQIVPREVLEPVTLSGVDIPAGAGLIVCLGAANRDESVFPDPERFDIHRENLEHISFGFGKHYCAGSRLAYLEARVALDTLLDELPNLRLRADEACGVVGVAFRSPNRLPVTFGA